jgi:hypothetical protein
VLYYAAKASAREAGLPIGGRNRPRLERHHVAQSHTARATPFRGFKLDALALFARWHHAAICHPMLLSVCSIDHNRSDRSGEKIIGREGGRLLRASLAIHDKMAAAAQTCACAPSHLFMIPLASRVVSAYSAAAAPARNAALAFSAFPLFALGRHRPQGEERHRQVPRRSAEGMMVPAAFTFATDCGRARLALTVALAAPGTTR